MGTVYYKNDRGLSMANGNSKIGTDTLILNMGSAKKCASRVLGFCKLGDACYARKAEIQYPAVLPSRNRQQMYWLKNDAETIAADIIEILTKTRRKNAKTGKMEALYHSIKYLRMNESGDFWSQKCITKLSKIAERLMSCYGISTYTYTAREDLYFKDASFNVKGSSNDAGNNGMTIAREIHPTMNTYSECMKGQMRYFHKCPGDCKTCDLCKVSNGLNIVFNLH